MRKRLAEQFIERAKNLGIKGKQRDEAALEFFMGAAYVTQLIDPPIDLTKAAWLVSIRGFSAVEDMAKQP